MFFVFYYIPDWYKTQEMCDRGVSEDPFLKIYCPNKYKTQGMCNQAIDDCLGDLNFSLLVCYK